MPSDSMKQTAGQSAKTIPIFLKPCFFFFGSVCGCFWLVNIRVGCEAWPQTRRKSIRNLRSCCEWKNEWINEWVSAWIDWIKCMAELNWINLNWFWFNEKHELNELNDANEMAKKWSWLVTLYSIQVGSSCSIDMWSGNRIERHEMQWMSGESTINQTNVLDIGWERSTITKQFFPLCLSLSNALTCSS